MQPVAPKLENPSDTAWRANLEALGQWNDAVIAKAPADEIAKLQARMDETADAYLATRRNRR